MLTYCDKLAFRLRSGARVAVAVLFCGLVLMMCSALSHAQRQTLSLGTAQLVGGIHLAPCNFPTPNQEWDTTNTLLTSCFQVKVSGCPNSYDLNNPLPPLSAFVAINHQPAGTTPGGTIVLLAGDGGKFFLTVGDGGSTYVKDYYNNLNPHFTTVQVAWADDWDDNTAESNFKSVKDEACRPATLLKFIYDHYAIPAGGAMCAQGHSGGASAIGYAMEFYGADRAANTINQTGYLDTVVMTSGPTLADIYNGCRYDPNVSQAPASNVCQGGVCVGSATQWQDCLEHPMGGQANCFPEEDPSRALYPEGGSYDTARAVAMHTVGLSNPDPKNCNNWRGNGATTAALDTAWHDMSLSPPPFHQYPKTFVYGFLCSGPHIEIDNGVDGIHLDHSNNSAAQGWSYLSVLQVSSGQNSGFPQIYRVDGCTDPEMIWGPGSTAIGTSLSGFEESKRVMRTFCSVHQ